MTLALTAPPALLVPTDDPKPVERAVVDGIVGDYPPETLLWIIFRRPDGGSHVHYAWTAGGHTLGDRIDQAATAAGYNSADWLHILSRHREIHHRGRVETHVHALRPIEGDVQSGWRAPQAAQEQLGRLLAEARQDRPSRRPEGVLPGWAGVGPALLTARPA